MIPLFMSCSGYACPVCHQSMMQVYPGTDKVECAICGISGHVVMDGKKAAYVFSELQQARSRMLYAGKLEHRNEIINGSRTQKPVEGLNELKMKYRHIGE